MISQLARSAQVHRIALGKVEGWCLSRPSEGVGGDYFEVCPDEHGDILIVVADGCGHGDPAEAQRRAFEASLRRLRPLHTSLSDLLGAINSDLAAQWGDDRYVTACLLHFEAARRRLTIANAGHPPPYLLTPGEVKCLDQPGYALGMFPLATFHEEQFDLNEEDSYLVLYTDGFEDEIEAGEKSMSQTIEAYRHLFKGDCQHALLALAKEGKVFHDRFINRDDAVLSTLRLVPQHIET